MKSISIVHTGYAVAVNRTRTDLAFCSAMMMTYRATWSVLPWTVFVLPWIVISGNGDQTETYTAQQSREKSNSITNYKYGILLQ